MNKEGKRLAVPEEAEKASFQQFLNEYRKQLAKGDIKEAYRGLMGYLEDLRLQLGKKYPDYFVSGSVHYGFMDYSYFYFFPKSLKQRKLKIVVLFVHDAFRFEVWLAGYNKRVQAKYWKLLKENNYNKYPMPANTTKADSIMEYVLVDNADFSDLETLTKQIEQRTRCFIEDVEGFLTKH